MTDIDIMMARLHGTSVPEAVASLDGARLAAEARSRLAINRKSGVAAGLAALMLGVAGSAIPAVAADAPTAIPLGAVSAFAPSALLAN